jgi:prepilin-type N-terminal cleavage/methylation domain-containing protein
MTSRRRGFTLLEIILASAIMAVIALSVFSAFRIAYQARDRALGAVGPARAGEIAMDMIRRDLESALPPKGVLSREFLGDEGPEVPGTSAVRFYAIGSNPNLSQDNNNSRYGASMTGSRQQQNPMAASGSIERVDLIVRSIGGEPALVRSVTRNLLSSTEPPPEDEVLCRGVTGFRVRYFDGYQWSETWDSTQYDNVLPLAVEVSIELTRPRDPTRAVVANDTSNLVAYRATRTFLLPCRDEMALTGGQQ